MTAPWAAETLPPFLRPATATATTAAPLRPPWQASDFLPDPSRPSFPAAVAALRASAARLPDELVVCLALAAVSDAALPVSLPALLNASAAATGEQALPSLPPRDHSGSDAHAWASFARAWSAEANRHGDTLRAWLYLSGRVDSGEVSRAVQRVIGAGAALTPASAAAAVATAAPRAEQKQHQSAGDYYAALMYAAYHLKCAGVAMANAARLAAYHTGEDDGDDEEEGRGDDDSGNNDNDDAACATARAALPRLLSAIAADKARHEAAFSAAAREAMLRDPAGALAALSSALSSGALLRHPAADGLGSSSSSSTLFLDASAVADALGILALRDRAAALDALAGSWGVARAGDAAARAAEARGDAEGAREARARAAFALAHGGRMRALADLQTERRLRDRRRGGGGGGGGGGGSAPRTSAPFAWVFGRECALS